MSQKGVSMPDPYEILIEYKQNLAKTLMSNPHNKGERMLEILCCPSFHVETSIEVIQQSEGTTLRLTSLNKSLWWNRHIEETIETFTESCLVSEWRAKRFWKKVESVNPLKLTDDYEPDVLDGIGLTIRYQAENHTNQHESHSPSRIHPDGILLKSTLDLGRWVLKTRDSRNRIKEIRSYL